MSDYDTRRATRYLPHVAVATTAVAVVPVVAVWWLRSRGVIASPWVGVGLALALSLVASFAGRAYWKRRRGPRDLLFGELLVWGWLRRVRMERQLARSMGLLRADEPPGCEVESAGRTFHVLSRLVVALEAQDAYIDGHSRRVAAHAVMVARRMGLSGEELARVRAAAAVHDIGKVRVPRDVLDKPGRLTSAEFELVKAHADAGAEIVACLGDSELTAIVRHHHEHFDGTGYPAGRAHEQIPLGARIVAVADTFDALTSARPYRPAASHKRALEAIAAASGSQLDPVAVRAFLRCYSGNRAIVFWTLLTVSPQRVAAWLGDKHPAPNNASLGSMTTTIGAATAIGIMAISVPLGPGPGIYGVRQVHQETPRAIAAGPVRLNVGARRTLALDPDHRPSTTPAPRRGHAGRGSGRVSEASRVAFMNSGAVRSHALRGSGGKSTGDSSGTPASGSNGGAGGGRASGFRGGPPSGSTGSSGGRSGGGEPAGGSNGGLGEKSGTGAESGSHGGSGGESHGGSSGESHGGSSGESHGGSSGESRHRSGG